MKCLNCKKEISLNAKYCSDKCRMAYNRANTQPEQVEPEQVKHPEQKQPEHTNPNTDRIGKVIKGYCHGCGRDLTTIKGLTTDGSLLTKEMADRICLCLHCFNKGITHESLGIDIDNPICQGV